MSASEFAVSGPEVYDIMDYAQANDESVAFAEMYPTYASACVLSTQDLSARITRNTDDKHTFALVDNVVRVRTLNREARQMRVSFWHERHVEMQKAEGVGVCGMIGSLILGATYLPPLAIFTGAVSLALTGLAYYRSGQACKQMELWSRDLAEVVAKQRTEALDKGLLSIYRHDVKKEREAPLRYGSILTPVELCGLHNAYFDQVMQDFSYKSQPKDKIAFVHFLARYSPLTRHLTDYGRVDPLTLERISFYRKEFERFLGAYDSIEERRSLQIKLIKEQANRKISEINGQEDAALSALRATYSAYVRSAREEKEASLAKLPFAGEEARDAIERTYTEKVNQAKEIYRLAKNGISYPFESMKDRVVEEKRARIFEVDKERDLQILPLYGHMKTLHEQARIAYVAEVPSIYPTFLDPYELSFTPPQFDTFTPSAPSYEEVFKVIRPEVDKGIFDDFFNGLTEQLGRAMGA